MALSGEIMKYVGNELVSKGAEKGLSKVADKAATSALSNILSKEAKNVGTSLAEKATGLGLAKNADKWVLDTGILDTDAGVAQVKDFMKPILGENTANYKRLLEQIGEGEYQMAHRPNLYLGDSEVKFPLSNMEADPDFLPKVYGDTPQGTVNNLLRLGNTGEEARKSANIIAQYQNQPDKMVKVYRQAPKDMNYGDWVGLTPEYANFHEGNSPDNRLWEREVPASEVMFAGDDINEWGYYPKQVQLDDELGQALDLAIQNTGADKSVANRAINYLKPKNVEGMLADNGGRPATLFHSTPNEFTKFDDARLGENTDYSNTGFGHFVTTDKDFSSRFKDINNEGITGRTMELRANVKNPITHPFMAGQKYSGDELDKIVENYYKAIGADDSLEMLREYAADDGQSLYDEYMDMTLGEDPFESAADERLALMKNGYDGIEIVEGPKSGLVEGSSDNTPVSSLAVFEGKNLSNINRIPVDKAKTTGVNIDIRRGKIGNRAGGTSSSDINWSDVNAVHSKAEETQKELDKVGRAIAEKNGFPEYRDFRAKSVESMLNKVKRKGGNYSLASMKDHTRNKIIMNGWQDVPAVLSDLEQMGMNPNVEFVQNEWGYKGLHLTGRFNNGLGWELQLSTPEDWPRKLKSDAIYDKWRNTELDTASPKEVMGYMNAMRESKAMWAQSRMPDLSIYDNVTGR